MNTLKMTELVRFWPSVSTLPHCFSAWLCRSLSSSWRWAHAVVGDSPHSLLLLGAWCVLVLGASVVLPLVTSRWYSHRNSVAVDDKSGSRSVRRSRASALECHHTLQPSACSAAM
jgi:hypothetical protein